MRPGRAVFLALVVVWALAQLMRWLRVEHNQVDMEQVTRVFENARRPMALSQPPSQAYFSSVRVTPSQEQWSDPPGPPLMFSPSPNMSPPPEASVMPPPDSVAHQVEESRGAHHPSGLDKESSDLGIGRDHTLSKFLLSTSGAAGCTPANDDDATAAGCSSACSRSAWAIDCQKCRCLRCTFCSVQRPASPPLVPAQLLSRSSAGSTAAFAARPSSPSPTAHALTSNPPSTGPRLRAEDGHDDEDYDYEVSRQFVSDDHFEDANRQSTFRDNETSSPSGADRSEGTWEASRRHISRRRVHTGEHASAGRQVTTGVPSSTARKAHLRKGSRQKRKRKKNLPSGGRQHKSTRNESIGASSSTLHPGLHRDKAANRAITTVPEGLLRAFGPAAMRKLAVGILTQSNESARFMTLRTTWLSHFAQVVVFESHTNMARAQQVWKYVPQRLYARFPAADFYLIVDDDVFINRALLYDFMASRNPEELAIYGPGFCDWGVKQALKQKINKVIRVQMPQFIHIVIGGIMLFTAAAVKRFSDANILLQCIDDLETLYSQDILLWDGLKKSAMYNQDWLFCWCLQVRMGGTVYLDNAFEDVQFPRQKCMTVADIAQSSIGAHHVSPAQARTLWRAYQRVAIRESWEWNASLVVEQYGDALISQENSLQGSSVPSGHSPGGRASSKANKTVNDPSRPQLCTLSFKGDPIEVQDVSLTSSPRPHSHIASVSNCTSALTDASQRVGYPRCVEHIKYVRKHPSKSACWGEAKRNQCEGFQLDPLDVCNVQYYLFCEGVYKFSVNKKRASWCPPPPGYPAHCCYSSSQSELQGTLRHHQRASRHARFLVQVFPQIKGQHSGDSNEE